jgi:predicted acyl esterase
VDRPGEELALVRATEPMRRVAPFAGLALALVLAGQARADTYDGWAPDPPTYGLETTRDVPVTLSDGHVSHVDVSRPADPTTGEPANGPFPVLMEITPYGKALGDGSDFVRRGYIFVTAPSRGGVDEPDTFSVDPLNGERETRDGIDLVNWAARLGGSSGKVGMVGGSYTGQNQILIAAAIGRRSPLKAIFPAVAAGDLYRDLQFPGGVLYEPSVPVYSTVFKGPDATQTAFDWQTGGDRSFEHDWWQKRLTVNKVEHVAANGVAMFAVAGWIDYGGGSALERWAGLQNALAGRWPYQPMRPDQRADRHHQILVGPWGHGHPSMTDVQLRWFDATLKGRSNGILQAAPVHLLPWNGTWMETDRYLFPKTSFRQLYLGDASLVADRPSDPAAADTIAWSGEDGCAPELATGGPNTCPPGSAATQLVYTTAPLDTPKLIGGPVTLHLELSSTREDAELVTTLYDVGPDGTQTQISRLTPQLASFRALDTTRTWYDDGRVIRAYHPFTRDSLKPLIPGAASAVEIDIPATMARLDKGHALRLVVRTSDANFVPNTTQLPNLGGGVYRLQRNAARASYLNVPFADPRAFTAGCGICPR